MPKPEVLDSLEESTWLPPGRQKKPETKEQEPRDRALELMTEHYEDLPRVSTAGHYS